ncbi:WxcM-like domain-containing protein [Candidatus Parcubacteria bacterium]|nr:WxcM-like domain-containing protein [Candidatus Parcubacteria bacterium]
MAKEFFKITNLEKHSDERGVLVEFARADKLKEGIKQVHSVTINPGKERGGHYHLKTMEWFFLVQGKAELILTNIESKEEQVFILEGEAPQLISIFPKVSHKIKNISEDISILLAVTSEPYDKDKPDTYKYEL